MNILFLLSSLEPAGSETYCLALEKAWKGRHKIFWISDRLHYGQDYLSLPISQKAVPGGLINVRKVAEFVRNNKIDLIHSHSRRAHWTAAQASWLAHVPHVATIHQPPPVHFFSKLWPCLGDATIAIDEAIVEHLQKYFARGLKKIALIRNGIEMTPHPSPLPEGEGGRRHYDVDARGGRPGEAPPRIVLLGRLSGGRKEAARFFLDVLKRCAATLPKARYQIVGRVQEADQEAWRHLLKEINAAVSPSTVELAGFQENLAGFLKGAACVVAAGRSAMESLAMGIPVIALGEGGVVGLVNEESWLECLRTNFGDHMGPRAYYFAKLELGLRELLAGAKRGLPEWGRSHVEQEYNIALIAPAVEALYASLI